MINWKVRFKNPKFVISFIAQLFIVLEMLVAGMNMSGAIHLNITHADFEQWQIWLVGLVQAVFVLLASLGVVQDPITRGYSDSEDAKKYTEPK